MYLIVMTLIHKLIDEEGQKKIARAVLKTQEYREASYNHAPHRYDKSIRESAVEACTEEGLEEWWGNCIADLNYDHWNDVQGWAENILKV